MPDTYTIGIDYGTNSVRAVVVSCADGRVLGTSIYPYPSGADGVLLDPQQPHLARQNPADYLEGLAASVAKALAEATQDREFSPERVVGVGVDTTGSTPIPVDERVRPLALDPRWRDDLAGHAWLWKDHTAADEAAAITEAARRLAPEYLSPIGGTYSSEWFWSKIWRCLKDAPEVFAAAASWVELADFIPAVLAGVRSPEAIRRCVCAAGHKAMYSERWGGLPSHRFLAELDPALAALRDRLYTKAFAADQPAGELASEWADRFGLRAGIPIAMGGFDAHYGAVGAGVEAGTFVKIIGTSTCDIAVARADHELADIPGICGIVLGSVMPDYYGIEAGQSAVGDILKWWVEGVCEGSEALHAELSQEAAALAPGASGLLALDWNNGNRTILVDPRLTGLLLGQTLHTTRAEVYRALIEATAFGARVIIERMREYGVAIERVVCCGGIAEKNDLFMQVYADVIGMPMLTAGSPQTPALGAAIAAAVAAGAAAEPGTGAETGAETGTELGPGATGGGYGTFEEAQRRMTAPGRRSFHPDRTAQAVYDELFVLYRELHDIFGGVAGAGGGTETGADLPSLMKRLLAIRERCTARAEAGVATS